AVPRPEASANGAPGGRSAASARSVRSRGGSGESVPAEAPGIPAPVVSTGERKGGTRASRRAALVRNLVARAMVHNNEARELLAAEASPPMPLQVSEGSEGAEAEPAEAAGEDAEDERRPSDPPRRDPSAGWTGTPWIGLGEDGRDPPEEKVGGTHPAPADGGKAASLTSLPSSVLFRPRDPLAGARPAGEWPCVVPEIPSRPPRDGLGCQARPRPEAATWRNPDAIDGIGRLAAMERVDGRRAAARDELLRRRGCSGSRSVGGYSVGGYSFGGRSSGDGRHPTGVGGRQLRRPQRRRTQRRWRTRSESRRLPYPDAVAGRRAPSLVAAPPDEPVPALPETRRRGARPPEAGRPEPRPVVAASVARAGWPGDQRDGVAAHVAHRAAAHAWGRGRVRGRGGEEEGVLQESPPRGREAAPEPGGGRGGVAD
ncbi:hypothetical protein THAOC_21996, partial [Thalassiosira oceanica]